MVFDRVPLRHLLLKVNNFGVHGNILRWIEAFLSNRLFSVKVGDVLSMQKRVLSVVPQGSVLGPLFFLIYTSGIKYSLKSSFVMYADDMKIYNKSCNFTVLQNDLDVVANWSCTWLLPINFEKCVVLYTNSSRYPKHDYHVNSMELFNVYCCRGLGVMVSTSLVWSNHISEVVKKANRTLFLLYLYKTLVRSVLEFANTVWGPSLNGDIALLEGVQRSTFQALTNNDSVIRSFFKLDMRGRTRVHPFKLVKGNFNTTARQIDIVNRVFGKWNSLSTKVVLSDSVLSFKCSYEQYTKV